MSNICIFAYSHIRIIVWCATSTMAQTKLGKPQFKIRSCFDSCWNIQTTWLFALWPRRMMCEIVSVIRILVTDLNEVSPIWMKSVYVTNIFSFHNVRHTISSFNTAHSVVALNKDNKLMIHILAFFSAYAANHAFIGIHANSALNLIHICLRSKVFAEQKLSKFLSTKKSVQ